MSTVQDLAIPGLPEHPEVAGAARRLRGAPARRALRVGSGPSSPRFFSDLGGLGWVFIPSFSSNARERRLSPARQRFCPLGNAECGEAHREVGEVGGFFWGGGGRKRKTPTKKERRTHLVWDFSSLSTTIKRRREPGTGHRRWEKAGSPRATPRWGITGPGAVQPPRTQG